MRLTEEQVRDRLARRLSTVLESVPSDDLARMVARSPDCYERALSAVGVRWVEDHYEEVGE